MFNTWIEVFLGKIGKYIVDFIGDYYHFIIPSIIAYGIFLTMASYNFKRIEKSVNKIIVSQAKKIIAEQNKTNYVDLADRIDIRWTKIIRQRSFFPYISQESELWVSRASIENVRKAIMQDAGKIRLVLERSGVFLMSRRPDVRKNLYGESFYRVTRKK